MKALFLVQSVHAQQYEPYDAKSIKLAYVDADASGKPTKAGYRALKEVCDGWPPFSKIINVENALRLNPELRKAVYSSVL